MNILNISYCPIEVANKIASIGSGIDSSWDCSRVDRVLFETLIKLIASLRIDTDS